MPITLTGNGTIDTYGQTVTLSGSLSGSGGLTKIDSGTLALGVANTYSGSTTISGGVLQLKNAQAAQDSTVSVNVNNGLAFGPGVTAPALGGLAGSGKINLATTDSSAVTLTVGGNNQNTTYTGTLSGSGGVTKAGTGALTLTASNTYTGGTIVEVGILVASNGTGGSATGSGSVTLSGGTLAGGSGGGSIAGAVDIGPACFGNRPRRRRLDRQVDHRQPALRLEPDHAQLRPDHSEGSGDLLMVTGNLAVVPGTAITFGVDPTVPATIA